MRDRAVSTVVTWTLTLLITALLVSGLLVATGGQIRDRTETVSRTEIDVVAQRVAADVALADRLVGSGGETVVVHTDLPATVARGGYTVETVVSGHDASVVVRDGRSVIRVPLTNRTPVRNATTNGGSLRVVYADGALEVEPA